MIQNKPLCWEAQSESCIDAQLCEILGNQPDIFCRFIGMSTPACRSRLTVAIRAESPPLGWPADRFHQDLGALEVKGAAPPELGGVAQPGIRAAIPGRRRGLYLSMLLWTETKCELLDFYGLKAFSSFLCPRFPASCFSPEHRGGTYP